MLWFSLYTALIDVWFVIRARVSVEVLLLVCLVYVVWLSVMCLLGWFVWWFLIL